MISARPIEEVQCDPKVTTQGRRRRFHKGLRLYITALVVLGCSVGMAVFIIFAARTVVLESRLDGLWALAGMGLFILCKIIGSWLTRSLHCQLCQGTILKDRGCFKHKEASKIPLLTHRFTAVAQILCTLRCRCMYCGTGYRLRK